MTENFQFLELRGERVFAALHRPAHTASSGVVMCHPLGEEKLWSHRVHVSFARALAAAGIAVFRFDNRGEGDSDREFSESDLDTRIEDACLAIDSLQSVCPSVTHITVLGLRFGAAVAATAAARHGGVARLILWDPVVDGSAYMQAVLRLNLMFQMSLHQKVLENREALVARLARGETVNIEGYELSDPLFRQASDFKLRDALAEFSGDVLIVQVNAGEAPLRPELISLTEGRERVRLTAVTEEPFWKEIKTFCQRSDALTRVSLEALGEDQ
jgi:exosortase A-associated hydrolase 2